MSNCNSSIIPRIGKPDKPSSDFPLFAHARGYWAKKIDGRQRCFGSWEDPEGALAEYQNFLHTRRTPGDSDDEFDLKKIINRFLERKQSRIATGELTERSYLDYQVASEYLLVHFKPHNRNITNLSPRDFAKLRDRLARGELTAAVREYRITTAAKKSGQPKPKPQRKWLVKPWKLTTLNNMIHRMRIIISSNRKIDKEALFGDAFERPSKGQIRKERKASGKKLFTAAEIRDTLTAAGPAMKAMILLAINAALGNTDCGLIRLSDVDLSAGILDFPRPKTGIDRRAILWPETTAAIQTALAERPEPKSPAHVDLVFITKRGGTWARGSTDQTVTKEFAKILSGLKIQRRGVGFYALRHTFRTVADEVKDQVACDHVMGHEIRNMSAAYRESISDSRLRTVSDHVRKWLFAGQKGCQQ